MTCTSLSPRRLAVSPQHRDVVFPGTGRGGAEPLPGNRSVSGAGERKWLTVAAPQTVWR